MRRIVNFFSRKHPCAHCGHRWYRKNDVVIRSFHSGKGPLCPKCEEPVYTEEGRLRIRGSIARSSKRWIKWTLRFAFALVLTFTAGWVALPFVVVALDLLTVPAILIVPGSFLLIFIASVLVLLLVEQKMYRHGSFYA